MINDSHCETTAVTLFIVRRILLALLRFPRLFAWVSILPSEKVQKGYPANEAMSILAHFCLKIGVFLCQLYLVQEMRYKCTRVILIVILLIFRPEGVWGSVRGGGGQSAGMNPQLGYSALVTMWHDKWFTL